MEYGVDVLEIRINLIVSDDSVLLIDDLLTTGGAVPAAIDLVKNMGGRITACGFKVNLVDFLGSK